MLEYKQTIDNRMFTYYIDDALIPHPDSTIKVWKQTNPCLFSPNDNNHYPLIPLTKSKKWEFKDEVIGKLTQKNVSVSTEAGTFRNCIEVTNYVDNLPDTRIYYAEGIGEVLFETYNQETKKFEKTSELQTIEFRHFFLPDDCKNTFNRK